MPFDRQFPLYKSEKALENVLYSLLSLRRLVRLGLGIDVDHWSKLALYNNS